MHSSSVLLSALVHGSAVVAAVVVPLLASQDLPAVRAPMTAFIRAQSAVRVPPRGTPASRPDPRPRAASPHAAPLYTPTGVAPEGRAPDMITDGVIGGVEPDAGAGAPFEFETGLTIAPPPPPPRPAVPRRVGGDVRPPRRVTYVAPEYPPLAITARIEGDVQLDAVIGIDGSVQQVRVLQAGPYLGEAAVEAVRQWRYTPTLLNGTPVPVVMTVTVSFRLR